MNCEKKFLGTIVKNLFDTKIIKDGDTLVVALSGGQDSMCLFDAFYKLQSECSYKLMALHVNHGIRGKEADRDEQFVRDYCKSFDIDLIVERVDAVSLSKKKNLTLEEAARNLRYDVFEKTWKNLSVKNNENDVYILVAHHEKDQVETIIHNIVRGTGIKGLTGMKKKSGYILRPLLDFKKEDIEKYIDYYDIPYVEDSTNEDIYYTRNYIRKEIIARLDKINNKASTHIIELSKMANDINEYIENESKKAFDDLTIDSSEKKVVINLKKIRLKDRIIKIGIIRETLNYLISTLKDITKINIDDIIKMTDKEKGGHLDLPYNITVDKKQQELIFKKNDKNISMSRRKNK